MMTMIIVMMIIQSSNLMAAAFVITTTTTTLPWLDFAYLLKHNIVRVMYQRCALFA
jgi:hypothetical protein